MGNIMREEIMSLDLNQEPLSQPQNSVIGQIEEFVITHGVVEERVRETEEVDSGPPIVHVGALAHVSADTRNEGGLFSGDNNSIEAQERVIGDGKSNKMNGAHLIAKALGIESDKVVAGCPEKGGFFDCNVCFDMAVEPILTCCGHLFCWPCFYNLPYDHSDVKECPVCGGEVTDAGLVPIYGNGDGNCPRKPKDSGLWTPPRPRAQRVESVRQNHANRGRIEERILRLTDMIGRIGERTSSLASQIRTSQPSPSNESSANQYRDAVRISRLVLRAASLTSLSSALNSAADPEERLADDLEAYSNDHAGRSSNNNQQSLHVDAFADAASVFASTALADSESSDIAAGSSSASLHSVLSLGLDINSPVPGSENQTANREIEETEFSSSASRTTPVARRVPDDEIHGVQRETRRRRLRI
ncbi:uncharacterized protein LOC21393474 [Morus notabilis]|nr:uncharacterized protein LOC21393474 [Morus notabilis]XP_024023225.1 uncharacterized protein LOC21393474 [Morus notabilis]